MEQDFVANARATERTPKGWPASLLMFHLAMWRERMRNALNDLEAGRPFEPPPTVEQQDDFNDSELAAGIGTPLADAAARSDRLLSEIIDVYTRIGERPMAWYVSTNTTEAVLRNSYTHPRTHLYEYLWENGDAAAALKLYEDALSDMRAADAPPIAMDNVVYNAACARARAGDGDGAIDLLTEVLPRRADVGQIAVKDPDFAALRENPRFKELTGA